MLANVSAIRHTRVDPDLCLVPNLGDDLRKESQRHWRAVELTSAMI